MIFGMPINYTAQSGGNRLYLVEGISRGRGFKLPTLVPNSRHRAPIGKLIHMDVGYVVDGVITSQIAGESEQHSQSL